MTPKEFALAAFKYFDIDSENIFVTDFEITSTFEEAVAAKKFLSEKGFKSMILVTSTYHTRRALMLFNFVFRGTGIKIYNSTAENILYRPEAWWRKEKDAENVIREYIAMTQNIIYHFILKKGRTSFDAY